MSTKQKFFAKIPLLHQQQNIRWLILEDDSAETGGWFIFAHQSLEQRSDFDSWYPTRPEAEREAIARWGVSANDWQTEAAQMGSDSLPDCP